MIESEQNPKVKLARALRRRRERARAGLVVVEGVRLVTDALAAAPAPELLFFTRAALAQPAVAALVERWQSAAWEVSEAVMGTIAETVSPQGIAAIVPLPQLPWPQQPTLLLVADGVRDPGNLGTLLRSAAAVGADGAIVPKGATDPWGDKALRAGMGAHFRLPLQDGVPWGEVEGLLAGLTVRLADAAATLSYEEADWSAPSALIVGGEATGAGEAALRRTDQKISIPMANQVESLNAAVAGSVILFEAMRQRRAARPG